jgi:hypothetical protein
MDTKGWAIVGAAIAIVGLYFSWTMFLSPEARVERTIDSATAAAEATDAAAFLSHFDAGYSDYLHADRATFDERIRDALSRVDRLNVTVQALEVEVDGDRATARFELVVVAFRGEDRLVVVGTPFQPEIVLATLHHDGSAWKLARVERGLPEP